MTTTSPDTLTSTVDGYLAAWNERDAAKRLELVAQVWADDGILTDPPASGTGHEQISGIHAALHEQFPGHQFVRASGVDAHHGFLRFAWHLVGPDGAVALAGMDVGVLAADGRLARIVGFFGDLPPAEG